MSLSELMSKFGLAVFAEIALVIFVVVFVGVTIRALLHSKKAVEHNRNLPFADGTAAGTSHASQEQP